MDEIWKDIEGYEGYYQVSNMARVKSLEKRVEGRRGILSERILMPQFNGHYYHFRLTISNEPKMHLLHRLVAAAYIPNPNNYRIVNHLDGDKLNCMPRNLEWTTVLGNTRHAIDTLGIVFGGEKHHSAKLNETGVREIIALYNAGCRIKDIASKFRVSKTNIKYIIKRKIWKHVKI